MTTKLLRAWAQTSGWVVLLSIGYAARAASVCVGPLATGNGSGSDWNNMMAWSATPARGDTWYLADGSYSGKTLSVAASGSTVITIKKATGSDHGTSTGWNLATMGSGQAAFSSGIDFESSYWVFDGQTGGGPNNWVNNFGFKVTCTADATALFRFGYSTPVSNINIRHVDMQGKGSVSTSGGSSSNDGLGIWSGSSITLSYAWMHGIGRCPIFEVNGGNFLFEYIYVQSFYGSSGVHSEVFSSGQGSISDTTFRYSLVTDVESTGGLMWDNHSNPSSHFYVYGNIFYRPPTATWGQANGVIGGWTGGNGEQFYNCYVYNNTFMNVNQECLSSLPQTFGGNQSVNNLFVNCQAPNFTCFTTHDYDCFMSSGTVQGESHGTTFTSTDPFVSSASFDFRLTANTTTGSSLGAPYDVDMLGNTRSTWTRGAIEFVNSTNPVVAVSPSTLAMGNVLVGSAITNSFRVSNIGGGSLSGVASVVAPFFIVAGSGAYTLGPNQSQTVLVGFSNSVVGAVTQTVTFTGGGGFTATVSATATNRPPQVSSISSSGTDVDPNSPGLQAYAGSVIQYAGTATDPNGLPLSWQWIYSVDGGTETVFQSGTGAVSPILYTYPMTAIGSSYTWKLRVSDGLSTAESDLVIGVESAPAAQGSLTFQASSGTITGPFTVANGSVFQTTSVSDATSGGTATYSFTLTNGGSFVIQALVSATNLANNSFYVNIDGAPVDPTMAWDIVPVTSGFEQRLVSWRGAGTADADQFVPEIFQLSAGTHQIVFQGREAYTQLQSFSILRLPDPPQNLHIMVGL